MEKNIMLAFVSPVSARSLQSPIKYPDIQGKPYEAIQTNESAIIYVERMLGEKNSSLDKIFLIASDMVKNEKAPSENEFGDVTHLEFLTRRLRKKFPHLTEKFSIQNYSEEGSGSTKLEKNILQIAGIADAVTDFALQNSNDKIKVHADMTGGFRHTSMLMLSVIQLLKYRGIEIGEVLYSEPTDRVVYRMTEIQRMFSLINGADEFVKFGSVDALRDYFGKNPPSAVKELLKAMNRFSDAIKICRTSAIEEELKNLGQHIEAFRENPDKDLQSALFAKIIDTIELEYGKLICTAGSRLEIIRWCIRKGFWQQAMTLCTEWLPEEIIDRKICMPRDLIIAKNAELEGISRGRNWQQQLIMAYNGKEKSFGKISDDDIADFCKGLRNELANFSRGTAVDPNNLYGELKKFLAEYSAGKNTFEACCSGKIMITPFKKKLPALANVLQAIYDDKKKNIGYHKNFYQFLQTVNYDKIPKTLASFNAEVLLTLFKVDKKKILPKSLGEKSESKWENREKDYREMFEKKIIHTDLDEETALKFLKHYYEIRRERNQINHANERATKKISELKTMIENYLDELEKVNEP